MCCISTGWFHEVTSFSGSSGQCHMALNYWFQPPDRLKGSPAGFTQPYRQGHAKLLSVVKLGRSLKSALLCRCGYWQAMWDGRPELNQVPAASTEPQPAIAVSTEPPTIGASANSKQADALISFDPAITSGALPGRSLQRRRCPAPVYGIGRRQHLNWLL